MTTFHEQMKQAREFDDGRTIRDYPSWTLQDYRDFMFCVEKGYLVQADFKTSFMINEEWEGEDIYAEEFDQKVVFEMGGEPIKRKFKVKNKDWVWCCGNKIPKEEEAVGCIDCF